MFYQGAFPFIDGLRVSISRNLGRIFAQSSQRDISFKISFVIPSQ